jgi:hypothetical protein
MSVVEYLGGACVDCGRTCDIYKDLWMFECSHRETSEKRFSINNWQGSYDELRLEADKCDLLCAWCHRNREKFIPPPNLVSYAAELGNPLLDPTLAKVGRRRKPG